MKENLNNYQNPSVFDKLLEPVLPFVGEQAQKLIRHHNEKFSFPEFFRLLIFYFVSGFSSVKLMINTSLAKELLSPDLNLTKVPYSTFNDAFGRFPPDLFKSVFISLLCSVSIQSVPELSGPGILYCADGSLFPTLKSMHRAEYKKNSNAVRLHLCFGLNRMIAANIMAGNGNSAERNALRQMLISGVTCIADRGYAGFRMFHDILQAQAHFIIRAKSNLPYSSVNSLTVDIPTCLKSLFSQVSDEAVQYDNDPHPYVWRPVRFQAGGDSFYILTDRFDLTTFQIIMLYAYRRQVELFFRFLKRTMNGIHLIKHNEDGVTTQFYAMLITALLQLKLKQDAIKESGCNAKETDTPTPDNKIAAPVGPIMSEPEDIPAYPSLQHENKCDIQSGKILSHPYQFFEMISETADRYWKIGIHWITALRQILHLPFDDHSIEILGSG